MPTSYVSTMAKPGNGCPAPKPNNALLAITEVTVLHTGGHFDPITEQGIQARVPNANVCEVKLKMAKIVAHLIPLRAGRWSISLASKGNFVHSFNSHIPFNVILSYEHVLLSPFWGSGQLCPSLGWMQLLVHSVPTSQEDNNLVFGPDALLAEVRTLPSLKQAFFAMPPKWLKPVDQISSPYSSVMFTISDPDGSVTNTLLKGRTALFGKEVQIQRWVNKPLLVQCSRCHMLGHNRSSRVCPLEGDSMKCYICGGAHKSDEHDLCCPHKHTIVGICNCSTYKCLNCHKLGHHCCKNCCPAHALFCPHRPRWPVRAPDKGKGRDPLKGPGLPLHPPQTHFNEIVDQDYDLFNPPPLLPNPTGPQI